MQKRNNWLYTLVKASVTESSETTRID